MRVHGSRRAGSAMIEFTLVGIPLIFILISVFELARGMWQYHTAAHAFREGTRFAIVHGNDCNIYPSNCAVTIRDISARIRDAALGLLPTDLENVTFDAYSGSNSTAIATRHFVCPTLADCLQGGSAGDTTYWPAGAPGTPEVAGGYRHINRIEISGEFPFRSAIAMFWPGAGRPSSFGVFRFPASSKEAVQF